MTGLLLEERPLTGIEQAERETGRRQLRRHLCDADGRMEEMRHLERTVFSGTLCIVRDADEITIPVRFDLDNSTQEALDARERRAEVESLTLGEAFELPADD